MSLQKLDIHQLLQNMDFKDLKPMQKEVLQQSEKHKDIIVLAPTGSGKTFAFLLPLLKVLNPEVNEVQSIILAPTRELALQIEKVFKQMKTGFKVLTCYGGHPFSRERASLKNPPALIIATPGRLLDHLKRETFDTNKIKHVIIDEYDKSLELGFSKEMQSILYFLPSVQKTTLTSATEINELPGYLKMHKPHYINYLDADYTPDLSYFYIQSEWTNKLKQLGELLKDIANEPTIVFCNFKNDIENVSTFLNEMDLAHSVFFGDLDQEEREKALLKFRNGSTKILLATDLASRGLDIPEIKNIVHFQIPSKEDVFTHRNGRTARMNKSGKVFLLLVEGKELPEYIIHNISPFSPSQSSTKDLTAEFTTLYFSAGKMHKISKGDVHGFLCQVGGVDKSEIGIIEIKDRASYAAISSSNVQNVIDKCQNQKLKKVKVRVDFA